MTVEIADRDSTRCDNKEMADNKQKMDKERMRFGMKVKLDHSRMSDEIKKLTFDLNLSIDNLMKANVQVKQLAGEQQKMK
jgi:hypothetical protein